MVVGIFCGVNDMEDEVGGFDSVLDLILNRCFEIVVGVFEAGGVNQNEFAVNRGHNIVASSSRFAGDDGDVFMSEAIKEAGFAGVGLAD